MSPTLPSALQCPFLAERTPNLTVLAGAITDCRGMVKTLVSGMKTIVWGAGSCKLPGSCEWCIEHGIDYPQHCACWDWGEEGNVMLCLLFLWPTDLCQVVCVWGGEGDDDALLRTTSQLLLRNILRKCFCPVRQLNSLMCSDLVSSSDLQQCPSFVSACMYVRTYVHIMSYVFWVFVCTVSLSSVFQLSPGGSGHL